MKNIATNSRCGLLTYTLCPPMQKMEYDAGIREGRMPNCDNCANACKEEDNRACRLWRPGFFEGVKEQSWCPTCKSTCCPFGHNPGVPHEVITIKKEVNY